jgi:hypothetical protein
MAPIMTTYLRGDPVSLMMICAPNDVENQTTRAEGLYRFIFVLKIVRKKIHFGKN